KMHRRPLARAVSISFRIHVDVDAARSITTTRYRLFLTRQVVSVLRSCPLRYLLVDTDAESTRLQRIGEPRPIVLSVRLEILASMTVRNEVVVAEKRADHDAAPAAL